MDSETTTPGYSHAPLSDLPAPFTAPGYEIMAELGRGGMGVVYKARQLSLQRLVALKMLRENALAGAEDLLRFQREAEAVAQVQHANIVQIFDIGQQEGRPYMALELVEGGSLAQKMKAGLLPLRQSAHIIEAVARAMHTVHERGIVHRDLKPGNILLTPDGQPKVGDFGLAKSFTHRVLATEATLTQTGDIIGTPDYMAPEQAAGRTHDLGPQTDIYALGAILYEMLTGQKPFGGSSTVQTLQRILHEEPTPPSELQPHVPRELQTICLTCLHKDPAARYPSARALADDLRAFLAGEPIAARPPGLGRRAWQALLRRPAVAALAGLGILCLVGLLAGAAWNSPWTLFSLAGVSLILASLWYGSRLRGALLESQRQHLQAQRNIERLYLLLEATQRLLRTQDQDEVLRILSETVATLANAERATIYLVDWQRRELWSRVALGDNVGDIRIPVGEGIAGHVAISGQTVNLSDPYRDPRFNPDVDRRTGYVTRNMLTMPIKARAGHIVGVFQILNKRSGPFGREDVDILFALSNSAALAIERMQV